MNGAEDVDSQKDAYPPKLCHLQLCVFWQLLLSYEPRDLHRPNWA